jgi:hypothetical protein
MKKELTARIALAGAAVLGAGGLADAQEQQSSFSQPRPELRPINPFLILNSERKAERWGGMRTVLGQA